MTQEPAPALVVYRDPLFEEHRFPGEHPERPERARAVVAGLEATGLVARWETARPGDLADVARVHDPDYARTVEAVAREGGAWLDPDTWVGPRSYEAALAASGTAVASVQAALAPGASGPDRRSFTVLRPPGHHARPGAGMGFCLFNHVAVAAAWARAAGGLARVAILDFDVHHGNGTQEVFYRDPAVLYVSLHRDRFYPGTGQADETGTGPGLGATLNIPLPGSTRPAAYRDAFRAALDRVAGFGPELLLVSAGFDAYRGDPVGGLGLSAADYGWMGAELRRVADAVCGGRLVSTLEGGYAVEALPELVGAYARGVAAGAPAD